jgi:hypothetical protein
MKGKAIVFKAPLKVSLEEINIPEPKEGQILIRRITPASARARKPAF